MQCLNYKQFLFRQDAIAIFRRRKEGASPSGRCLEPTFKILQNLAPSSRVNHEQFLLCRTIVLGIKVGESLDFNLYGLQGHVQQVSQILDPEFNSYLTTITMADCVGLHGFQNIPHSQLQSEMV